MTLYSLSPEFNSEEHATWRRFHAAFFSKIQDLNPILHPFYRANLDTLAALGDGIPSLEFIQELLAPIGWTACYVDGYIEPWRVARLIRGHVMPLSRTIRPADEVHFAREPDLIHDIFGHLPSLLHPEYRRLLEIWSHSANTAAITPADRAQFHLNKTKVTLVPADGGLASQHLDAALAAMGDFFAVSPTKLYLIDKLYFWIFEFGILRRDDGLSVLGAGLISSLAELSALAEGQQSAIIKPLTIDSLLQPYLISDRQDTYLAGRGLEDFYRVLYQLSDYLREPSLNEVHS